MSHFSSAYTRVLMSPLARPGAGPSAIRVAIILTVALEENAVPAAVNRDALDRLLTDAFRRAAGGRRSINGVAYDISWALNWVDPARVAQGTALGVRLAPEAAFATANQGRPVDGIYEEISHSRPGFPVLRRVYLQGALAARCLRGGTERDRNRFANEAVHEMAGHAQGFPHTPGTVLQHTNSGDERRQMNDAQILYMLEQLLREEDASAPAAAPPTARPAEAH